MKSVIETVKDPCAISNEDFAIVFGVPRRKPEYYRNKLDGSEYSHLQGAIAWPNPGVAAGCAIIVAVTRDDTPMFKILEASYGNHPYNLLLACMELKRKYTPDQTPRLLQQWIGDNFFSPYLDEVNRKENLKMYLTSPIGKDELKKDQILIEKIRTLSDAGRISIIPEGFADEIRSMVLTDVNNSISYFPAATAAAYSLYYLSIMKPWLRKDSSPKNYNPETVQG